MFHRYSGHQFAWVTDCRDFEIQERNRNRGEIGHGSSLHRRLTLTVEGTLRNTCFWGVGVLKRWYP